MDYDGDAEPVPPRGGKTLSRHGKKKQHQRGRKGAADAESLHELVGVGGIASEERAARSEKPSTTVDAHIELD